MQGATDFCAKRIPELQPDFQENTPNALASVSVETSLAAIRKRKKSDETIDGGLAKDAKIPGS